jgi:type IV pilus assembly protein PilB
MMEDKLLKLLYEESVISQEQYQKVAQECEKSSARPETVLEQFGILKEDDVVKFLSKKFRMALVNWDDYTVDQELLALVPESIAIKYTVFPFSLERGKRGGKITLAVADPSDVSAIDDISFRTGCIVKTVVASARAIHQAIQRHYGEQEALPRIRETDTQQERLSRREKFPLTRIEEFDSLLPRLLSPEEVDEEEMDALSSLDQEHPSTKLLLDLLNTAVEQNISEIHLEPSGQEYRIRLRLYGYLHQHNTIPDQVGRDIAVRLRKIAFCGDSPALSPKKEYTPWIGSFYTVQVKGKLLTVLVSFYPTPYGEKMLLKLADGSSLVPLENLGVGEKALKILNRMLTKSEGLLLLVGPPGQGKTTTLHSIIRQFDHAGMNILTLESPVELLMPGINQISFNPQTSYQEWYSLFSYNAPDFVAIENTNNALMARLAFELASSTSVLTSLTALDLTDGLCTFIALIRSALRLAGRRETSLTPLDDNTPLDTLKGERMSALPGASIEPLLLNSINGMISQRLVRTICPACKEIVTISGQDLELIRWLTANEEHVGSFPIYAGKGCQECMGTGYSGQTGIFEVIKFDKHLKQSLLDNQPISSFNWRQFFTDTPVDTLKKQGLQKLLDGITSLEEIRRTLFTAN